MIDAYCDGDCLILAFALHWMCGWKVFALSEKDANVHLHFAAEGPGGDAWDARGPRHFDVARDDYADDGIWVEIDPYRFICTDPNVDEERITQACRDAETIFPGSLDEHVMRRPKEIQGEFA